LGHKYVYNKPELVVRLITAGFGSGCTKETVFGESQYAELRNIDTRIDSMVFDVIK
jgi:hypothetical protein